MRPVDPASRMPKINSSSPADSATRNSKYLSTHLSRDHNKMIGFGYMISTFISKAASAKTVGFCVFIVGFITQIITFFGFPYDGTFPKLYWIIWSFFPPNLLAIALFYLSQATTNPNDPGINWSGRKVCSYGQPNCVLTMENVLGWMVGTFVLWLCSAIYLNNVLPDTNGVRKPWYYIFQRSYWSGNLEEAYHDVNKHSSRRPSANEVVQDEDVKEEEANVRRSMNGNMNNADIAVQVRDLVKTYSKKGTCCKKPTVFHTMKGLWITDGDGKVQEV